MALETGHIAEEKCEKDSAKSPHKVTAKIVNWITA
jgi:hypothetical protein